MKRCTNLILFSMLFAFILGFTTTITQAQMNRPPRESTPQIFQLGSTAMIPASYFTTLAGVTTQSNGRTGRVVMSYKDNTLEMTQNSKEAQRNNRPYTMEAPLLEVAGVQYVPLQSTANVLGLTANAKSGTNQITIVNPNTGRNVILPISGRILSTTANFTGDRRPETAYGAYINFTAQHNERINGRSVLNPNLPMVWVVRGPQTVWQQSYPNENEIAQLSNANLTGSGRPSLWVTTRLVGADNVGTYFRAYNWQQRTFRNITGTREGYLTYDDNGGLIARSGNTPPQLVLYTARYGVPRSNGVVGLIVQTYQWNGRNYALQRTQRTTGRYNNDPYATLRDQFNIPVTRRSMQALRQGEVAIQNS